MNSKSNPGETAHPLKSKPLIISAIAIVVVVTAVILMTPGESGITDTAYFTAKRGEFLISIVEGGNLSAVRETTIRNEVEGTARVISIVPEGSYVKKGDVLVELDSGDAENQRNQQEITVREAELAVTNALEQINIGISQTNSDITAAKINLELAKIDLQKFKEGELAQNQRQLELDVETADADRVVALETFLNSSNLFANNFETKFTMDRDRINWQKAEKSYINATNALWMDIQFDQTKQLRTFEGAVATETENLNRVIFQSRAEMAQYQADLVTKQRALELQKEKLERDIRNLDGCVITAPTDGLVVYPETRSRFSSESMIEEGATVRYRQELVKLPDTSQMKLNVKVHESHVSNVREGQLAFVILDPMPEKQFRGTVKKVAVMPNSADRFGNPDLKVYDTEIVLNESLPDTIKPGASARAEIVVAKLENAITVPVQAVTTLKGKSVVYLSGANPQPVPVEVGLFNTKMIQIVSGVNEGDKVLLSPPLDASEGSIDGSIIEDGLDIEVTNLVTVADTKSRGNERGGAPDNQPSGGQSRGGFDREAMMKQYDTDGDGQLNEQERQAMRSAMGARSGGGAASEGRGDGGSRSGGGGFDREAMMKRLDTDGDGQISEAEREAARAQFGGGGSGRSRDGGTSN